MKKILTSLFALCSLVSVMACSCPDPSTSSATSGAGGSSSSSGSGGEGGSGGSVSVPACLEDQTMNCTPECVVQACQRCQGVGCTAEDDVCYVGFVHYSDMIGCLQMTSVQANCPACKDITVGDPILSDCSSCAAEYSQCTFDCVKAAGL